MLSFLLSSAKRMSNISDNYASRAQCYNGSGSQRFQVPSEMGTNEGLKMSIFKHSKIDNVAYFKQFSKRICQHAYAVNSLFHFSKRNEKENTTKRKFFFIKRKIITLKRSKRLTRLPVCTVADQFYVCEILFFGFRQNRLLRRRRKKVVEILQKINEHSQEVFLKLFELFEKLYLKSFEFTSW